MTLDKNDLLLEEWKMASELQRHEDTLTWQKFNYFIVTNGILISALGVVISFAMQGAHIRIPAFSISVFGIIVSFTWVILQRRSQLYHSYRISQAKSIEEKLKINGKRVLTLYDKGISEQNLVNKPELPGSAHKYMLSLGIILVIGWITILHLLLISLQ